LRISGVAGDGYLVGRSDGGEEGVGGEQVTLAEEDYGGAGLDEEEDLGGLFYGEEIGDGLFDVIVEEMEVFAMQAFDEVAGGIGDRYADVDAVYRDADGGRLLGADWEGGGAEEE